MWNDTEIGQARKRTHEDGNNNNRNSSDSEIGPLQESILRDKDPDYDDDDKIVSPYINGSMMKGAGVGVGVGGVEESHMRSLAKGFTWRLVASGTTITITYFVTGQVGTALKIGFVEFFAKIMIYYAHERCWAKIRFI